MAGSPAKPFAPGRFPHPVLSIMFTLSSRLFRTGFFLAGGLCADSVLAQPTARATAAPWSFGMELGASVGAELSDRTGSGGDLDIFHASTTVTHRQSFADGKTGLALELDYDRYELDAGSGWVPLPDRAQSLSVQATLRRPLTERWTLLASVRPTLANTGSGLDGDGSGVTVGLLGTYRQSETLTWGLGVLYRSLAEDDLRVLPAIGVEWRFAPAWRVDVGFPRTALTYAVNERLHWSLSAAGHGGTFHVDEVRGSPVPLNDTLLDYTEIRVGLGFQYEPRPGLTVSLTAGAIVHQEFDYFERGYKIETDNTPGFVRAGIAWQF